MHRITGKLRWLLLALPAFAALTLGLPTMARAEVTPVTIATTALPAAQVGVVYAQTLDADGGATPYSWAIIVGALPAGLALDTATGAIGGTPTTAGDATFTAQVTDDGSQTASQALAIHVAAAAESPAATHVDAICASDLSAQPELETLCALYANDTFPDWVRPIIARIILRIGGDEVRSGTVRGRVASLSGATINVDTSDDTDDTDGTEDTVAVVTDADTTFSRDGETAMLADVQVGDKVAAKGTRNADGSLQAQSVRLQSAEHESDRARVSGTVMAIDGANLAIGRGRGHGSDDADSADGRPDATQTVITTDATVFTQDGDTISLADIEVGARIKATGTLDADGALVASTVKVDGKTKPNAGIRARGDAGLNGIARSCDAKPGQRGEHGRTLGLKQRCGQDQQD